MGGSCYDRDVISTSSNRAFSDISDTVISRSGVDDDLLPKYPGARKCREIDCFHKNPIVCIFDVTGSMGDWSKTIYDKLPLFFGEVEKQGYLTDPAISFAAVGDAYTDRAPIQVCNFSQSRELDDYLSRVFLEAGGGGQNMESYELMAYYYLHHCILSKPELSFLFITGDEGFYPHIEPSQVKNLFGDSIEKLESRKVFEQLRNKFNVFLIHKRYEYDGMEGKILKQWKDVLGERILMLNDPKAIIDVMLGAVALTSGSRSLDTYLKDMKDRGQSTRRLKDVENSLSQYHESLALVKVTVKGRLPVPVKKDKK
ncbi:MAG: hypothetical protein RDV48_00320 [Candidatus Eremiobacteraeota bacterium]|nr:hypothetical protein [Candidatus Eremiobacteraeota bacterium]